MSFESYYQCLLELCDLMHLNIIFTLKDLMELVDVCTYSYIQSITNNIGVHVQLRFKVYDESYKNRLRDQSYFI